MATQHPHHAVILAYLSGETVQCFIKEENKWHDCVPWGIDRYTSLPGFNQGIPYRIKPKPKKYKVALMRYNKNISATFPQTYWEKDWTRVEECPIFVRWLTDVMEHEETV